MPYGLVWVRNASLFFKAFQNGRPNWKVRRDLVGALNCDAFERRVAAELEALQPYRRK
jgi:hypothetical protein